jgi:enhanced filamentous growth protein 1
VVAATERRRIDGVPSRNGQTSQPPPLHHHHSMHSTIGSQMPPTPHSIAPHPGAGRPGLDRAHTFPTPPTSASSVMGMGNQGSSYEWGAPSMNSGVTGTQPLSIDTGLSNARSMPTTPATTPPGSSISNMQSYQSQQSFDGSKSFYSGPPSSQSAYASQQTPTQQTMARFGGPMTSNSYVKNEMGPPSAPGTVGAGDGEHSDIKAEQYSHGHVSTGSADTDSEHQQDNSYMGANTSAYGNNRTQYAYNPPSSVGTVQGDHAHLSPDMSGSPHQGGSGRATPRGTNGPQQWQQGYQTPPRVAPSSNLYSVMSDSRGPGGTPTSDHYPSAYSATSLSGASTSTKRAREDESDTSRPDSRGIEPNYDLKRRKTIRQDAMGVPMGQMAGMQGIKTGIGMARQR